MLSSWISLRSLTRYHTGGYCTNQIISELEDLLTSGSAHDSLSALKKWCLDPYNLNSFSYLDPISINVSRCMTSLLKLEITVSFLAFIASSFRVTEED